MDAFLFDDEDEVAFSQQPLSQQSQASFLSQQTQADEGDDSQPQPLSQPLSQQQPDDDSQEPFSQLSQQSSYAQSQQPSQSQLSQSQQPSQPSQTQQTQQSQQTTATLQVCRTCGGTEWDYSSDGTVATCQRCYAAAAGGPSQTQDGTTLDYDEVMAMGGRTRRGKLAFHKSTGARTGRRGRVRHDTQELHHAQVLPPLATCLAGVSCVLARCTQRIVALHSRTSDNSKAHAALLHRLVGRLWTRYLRSWACGAAHYGARHATVRLCLRDFFLVAVRKEAVHRVLAAPVVAAATMAADATTREEDRAEEEDYREDDDKDDDSEGEDVTPPRKRTRFQVDAQDKKDDASEEEDFRFLDFLPEAQGDNESNDDSHDEEEGNRNSQRMTHSSKRKRQADAVASNPPATTHRGNYQTGYRRDLPWTYQMVAYQAYRQTKGCREAALLLTPSMSLVLAILVTATSRLGIATGQVLDWVAAGDLPLWNAYESKLMSRTLRTKLTLVRSFFCLYRLPQAYSLERKATLLLLAAGVKSWEAWRGLDETNNNGSRLYEATVEDSLPRGTPGLVLSAVPVVLAQCTADLGLGQTVLQTALSMVGLTPGRVLAPAAAIATMAHALAILFCAVIFLEDWRQGDFLHGDATTSIPWNEHAFGKLANGAAVHKYVGFCEDVVFAAADSVAPEFTDLLQTADKEGPAKENQDALSVDSAAPALPRVRPCPIVISAGPQQYLHPTMSAKRSPLNRLVWQALRRNHRRGDEPSPRTLPSLDPAEGLLLDFLAHGAHVARQDLRTALGDVLLAGRIRYRKRGPVPDYEDVLPIPTQITRL
jgi:hypothetical protein